MERVAGHYTVVGPRVGARARALSMADTPPDRHSAWLAYGLIGTPPGWRKAWSEHRPNRARIRLRATARRPRVAPRAPIHPVSVGTPTETATSTPIEGCGCGYLSGTVGTPTTGYRSLDGSPGPCTDHRLVPVRDTERCVAAGAVSRRWCGSARAGTGPRSRGPERPCRSSRNPSSHRMAERRARRQWWHRHAG